MALTPYIHAFRRQWIMLLLSVVLGGGAAAALSYMQTPIYQSDTRLFVSTNGIGSDGNQLNQGSNFTQQRVKSYADIVSSPAVLGPVVAKLGLGESVSDLSKMVSATAAPDTVILEIAVRDSSPNRARDIAKAVGEQFISLVEDIERPPSSAVSPVKISVVEEAEIPQGPVAPRKKFSVSVGLALGLAIGGGIAIARDSFDKTVRSRDAAADLTGSPILGAIPQDTAMHSHSLLLPSEHPTLGAEAFKRLQANIRFLSVDRKIRSLVVTGSVPDEGKTTTAANLAVALAQAGDPTILVDGDLRRGRLSDLFALSRGVGLTSVLLGDVAVSDAAQRWRHDLPLLILPSGPTPPNPVELLGSTRLSDTVDALVDDGFTVIFDSPPLVPVVDAALLAQATDGALLVVRVGKTRSDQIISSVEALRATGSQILGVVANRVQREPGHSYYSDVYGVSGA
ncbi:polysaccharide biosynthesis tyrosine autokinase [Cryptosporangium phraense]|uniref:Polysaccharide biosynthesis tyrosine autokinase n=1 Tax=Cryptosporangium phraense TaxID=2593070 RepID=A0A545AJA3_9ACTN|nr:polysaccharide biosynthesis tyrosine autokinase [Cryptosporangium phraense]TQS41393.1 polysaccharide biosynthesis tyrosine autokinase [Cryptosporangium phraense]